MQEGGHQGPRGIVVVPDLSFALAGKGAGEEGLSEEGLLYGTRRL